MEKGFNATEARLRTKEAQASLELAIELPPDTTEQVNAEINTLIVEHLENAHKAIEHVIEQGIGLSNVRYTFTQELDKVDTYPISSYTELMDTVMTRVNNELQNEGFLTQLYPAQIYDNLVSHTDAPKRIQSILQIAWI